jgi:hypothetical protein
MAGTRGRTGTGGRVAVTTFVLALLLSLSCGSITREELACEQAVAHLSDCCPALDTRRLPCFRIREGCSGDTEPMLTEVAATCVLDASCDSLRAARCERLVALSLVPHSLKDREEIETEACR